MNSYDRKINSNRRNHEIMIDWGTLTYSHGARPIYAERTMTQLFFPCYTRAQHKGIASNIEGEILVSFWTSRNSGIMSRHYLELSGVWNFERAVIISPSGIALFKTILYPHQALLSSRLSTSKYALLSSDYAYNLDKAKNNTKLKLATIKWKTYPLRR